MALEITEVAELSQRVLEEVEKAVVGKRTALEHIMAGILCAGGHILLEDYPGLAKTLVANSFAIALGLSFKRIQFTPDLLPGDITGGYFFDRAQERFVLRQGPIFAQIILADEVNRASPKTQSALLEAMQEYQVTLEGETLRLPEPFIVIATQNPIEFEGTFPLPEAQLDRFLMKLSLGYPSKEHEMDILRRRRERKSDAFSLNAVVDDAGLSAMRLAVEEVYVDADIEGYIVDLVAATRAHRQVAVGASPRGSLALLKLARAWAAMNGRPYVIPDDVKRFAHLALGHRLIVQPDLWVVRQAADRIIDDVLAGVPTPVIEESP
jgi:MoxR-like ATPase